MRNRGAAPTPFRYLRGVIDNANSAVAQPNRSTSAPPGAPAVAARPAERGPAQTQPIAATTTRRQYEPGPSPTTSTYQLAAASLLRSWRSSRLPTPDQATRGPSTQNSKCTGRRSASVQRAGLCPHAMNGSPRGRVTPPAVQQRLSAHLAPAGTPSRAPLPVVVVLDKLNARPANATAGPRHGPGSTRNSHFWSRPLLRRSLVSKTTRGQIGLSSPNAGVDVDEQGPRLWASAPPRRSSGPAGVQPGKSTPAA